MTPMSASTGHGIACNSRPDVVLASSPPPMAIAVFRNFADLAIFIARFSLRFAIDNKGRSASGEH